MQRNRTSLTIEIAITLAISAATSIGCMIEAPDNREESNVSSSATSSGCHADCEDGSSASVSCTGLCEIVNQNCTNNIQGHARCLSTGAIDQCDNQCSCTPRQCLPYECGLIHDECTDNYISCGPCNTCSLIWSVKTRVTGVGATCYEAYNDAVYIARRNASCDAICDERIKPLLCAAVPPGKPFWQPIDYQFRCSLSL